MTPSGGHRSSAAWQTWLALAGTMAVGRWLAGGGFGYTLFACVWAPIATLWIVPLHLGRRYVLSAICVVALFAVGWLPGRPVLSTLELTACLTMFVSVSLSIRRLLAVLSDMSEGLATLVWLAAVAVPLLMSDTIAHAVGEATAAAWAGYSPILVANAADATAGDWTHQQIAYATLTRLGQSVGFDWPGRTAYWIYGVIGLLGHIVPRGTMNSYGRRGVHEVAVDG